MPKLSKRQKLYSRACRLLSGDRFEERANGLLPRPMFWFLRKPLYKFFSDLRFKEAKRLREKFKTTCGYY